MLLTIITGISAVITAVITFTQYISEPIYKLLWIVPLMLIGFIVGITLLYALILFVITGLFVDLDKKQERPSKFWLVQTKAVAAAVCTIFNLRVHVSGLEMIPKDKRFLMVSNHRSIFDPVVKFPVFYDYGMAYVSKASNFKKIPIGGRMMHKVCCLAIDRENNREALKTINEMIRLIKEDIASVTIYPEGTRNKGEGLLPFHAGSFKAAQKTGSPVVVVAIQGTDKIIGNAPFKKTDIYLDVVKVIDGEFAKNNPTKVTAEIAREAIAEKIKKSEEYKETVKV